MEREEQSRCEKRGGKRGAVERGGERGKGGVRKGEGQGEEPTQTDSNPRNPLQRPRIYVESRERDREQYIT